MIVKAGVLAEVEVLSVAVHWPVSIEECLWLRYTPINSNCNTFPILHILRRSARAKLGIE